MSAYGLELLDYTNVLSIYTHTYEGIHTEPTKDVNTSAVSSHPPRPQKRGAPPSHLSARHSELKNQHFDRQVIELSWPWPWLP